MSLEDSIKRFQQAQLRRIGEMVREYNSDLNMAIFSDSLLSDEDKISAAKTLKINAGSLTENPEEYLQKLTEKAKKMQADLTKKYAGNA